jgi:hypothetical protein
MEIAAAITGTILFFSLMGWIVYQFTYRERPAPGYLEPFMMNDFEPDTRTNAERLAESKRLIDFELKRLKEKQ